jgi:hypothetical protein
MTIHRIHQFGSALYFEPGTGGAGGKVEYDFLGASELSMKLKKIL